jgi:hypothetical protein
MTKAGFAEQQAKFVILRRPGPAPESNTADGAHHQQRRYRVLGAAHMKVRHDLGNSLAGLPS